jgi:4-amino-4-deoxy-L-arabinose transferase-like glycosyltransferase
LVFGRHGGLTPRRSPFLDPSPVPQYRRDVMWNAANINDSPARRALLAGGLAFILAMLLLSPRVSLGPLRHWDEAWYAQVSREMLDADDWLTPRWNGEPWFHKPPLAFWATMASFSAFGISEPSARLFSTLCGSLTIAAVAAFLAHRFSFSIGLFGAILLTAIPGFSRYAARGQLDGPLTLFVSLHLLSFWSARMNPRWHWLAGICFGLSVMTKGAAAGLAFVVIGAFSLSMREFAFLKQRSFWGGIAVALVIAAPWHIHQLATHGDKFLNDYGTRHFTQFFDRIPGEETPGPRWDYYLQSLSRSAPWGWAILTLGATAAVSLLWSRDPLLRFSAAWTVAIPVALSFARTKWSWYLAPMYPGAAIFAVEFARRSTWIHRHRKPLMSLCGLLAVAVACEPFVFGAKEGEAEIKALAPLVQANVPPEAGLHTLQLGKVRRSVYPIAPLYYTQRRTYAIHSWEEFTRVMTGEKRCLHLLMRDSELASLADHLPNGGIQIERLGAAGDVALVRIQSGRAGSVSDRSSAQSSMALQDNRKDSPR